MNVLLETYLEDARVNLTHLPSWKRDLELMELRSHLEAGVAARVELGEESEAATRETLAQFGEVREVCGGLVQADQRERLRVLDTPVRATLLAAILFFMVDVASNIVATSFLTACVRAHLIETAVFTLGTLVTACGGFAVRILVAWHMGKLAPRYGVVGAALGYGLGLFTAIPFLNLLYPVLNPGTMAGLFGPLPDTLLSITRDVLCFAGAAWLAARQSRARTLGKSLL